LTISLDSQLRVTGIHQTNFNKDRTNDEETIMKRLQANRLPLLALIVMVLNVMGLILMATTRRARAATTIHVTTTADSSAGSLRQAIADAQAGDTIDFNLSYPATIKLTSAPLTINKNLTINGPGADKLTVSGNHSVLVLNINSGSTATISGLTVADGFNLDQATFQASGILIDHSTLNLNNCTVANTRNPAGRGGIASTASTVTLTNCTIATNTAAEGAGIQNGGLVVGDSGTMTIANCTIANNVSIGGNGGGGIVNHRTMTITNSTITGNQSNNGGGGILSDGPLTVTNCTIARNHTFPGQNGPTGGGIFGGNMITLNNTIIAGNYLSPNRTPNEIFGIIATTSHNLIGDAATAGGMQNGVNGNIVSSGTLPIGTILNTTLADNGGPTQTHMIICNSLAYNAGDNALAAALPKDQRGSSRVIDGTVDIGALEVHPVNNTNDSGPGSLRQVITDAAPGDCIDIDSCLTGTITLTSGQFRIRKDLTINGPGADQLTISGNNASSLFYIGHVGNVATNFAINRLTLANANGPSSAINNDQSNLTLNNCTVSHNTGDSFGGILTTEGSLTLNNCTVSHNTGNNGGGIVSFPLPGGSPGQLTINSCTISDNAATTSGGGIYNESGSVAINNSTIANNSAANGGGIYSKSGTLTLNNSTISNNSASSLGGGIYNNTNAELTVTNSTITGNRCDTPGLVSGGIQLSGTETLNNSIIAGNFTSSGTTPGDLFGTADNASHNLIGDAGSAGGIQNGANGNLVGVSVTTVLNPMLADNGGPTKTHALVCGSPAIDAGDNTLASTLATDQRSLLRIYDGNGDATATVDIGAFEQQNTCPTITAQTVSLAKNSSLTGVQIATVKDAEDVEASLAVTINSPLNNVTVSNLSVAADGKVTANVTAPCNATSASFTLSVKDSAMQTVQATLTVTVTASNAPSFTSCPGNITRSNDPGQCTASVSFAPTASDDCAGSIVPVCKVGDTTITSPYPFPKGITTVTCTATDADNQTATCSFTVTVNDVTAPTITCASVAAQSVSTDSNCSALVPDVTNLVRAQSSDNCTARAGLVITQSPAADTSVSGTGSHPITVTVKDADNNETTCVVGFTLNDTTAPTINCPANITKSTDLNQCAAIVNFAPTATDNCSGVGTPTCTPPSGSSFPKGTTTVTCTVKDAANNQSTPCSFTITVNDMQPPSIVCTANISVPAASGQCGATVSYNAPIVSDNCPGVGAPLCAPPSGSNFPKGTTMVTCTVKDAANNQSTCSFTVTVVDTQAPTIVCPANLIANTANAGDNSVAVTFAAPTAADNCSGVNIACVPPSGSFFPRGTTTVTCTATDASGNQTSCAFTVKVFDYVIVDDSNGRILRFISTTGEYDFFDCRKNQSLSRFGVVTISSCKATLTDVGPDTKHPDRNVSVTANPCTKVGSASVTYGGVTATLTDANLSNNIVRCP
jgi:hypothetical protein